MQHALREVLLAQRRRVRPRLQPVLLADRLGKARAPAVARELLVDVDLGVGVDEARVAAHIVVDGGELDELAQERNGTRRAQVLVADDGLSDSLGLGLGRNGLELLADEVEGQEAAVELK